MPQRALALPDHLEVAAFDQNEDPRFLEPFAQADVMELARVTDRDPS